MTTAAIRDYDAIVVGAGVAGSVAAAALAGQGLSILMVEPGQRTERRLAGELLHPPALSGLRDLGFSVPARAEQAVRIQGFAVFHASAAADEPTILPYGAGGCAGLALSHGLLRSELASQAAALAGVNVLHGARVTALDVSRPGELLATIRGEGERSVVRARIVIAADGAASAVRGMAGIGHRRRRLSTLVGLLAPRDSLPHPGYGHLFLGAPAPALAYEIGGDDVRVMFDLPGGTEAGNGIPAEYSAALPPALRAEVAQGRQALRYNSQEVTVECVARGRVALVGDAGGSCHPLTATGMTVAITDGLALRAALREKPGDLGAALARYGRRRRAAHRTRRLIASALYETCSGSGPELLVLRRGLERYWRDDARGRAASMALLAMMDVRLRSAVREMVAVIRHGMPRSPNESWAAPQALLHRSRLTIGLSRMVARHVGEALRAR